MGKALNTFYFCELLDCPIQPVLVYVFIKLLNPVQVSNVCNDSILMLINNCSKFTFESGKRQTCIDKCFVTIKWGISCVLAFTSINKFN